MTISPASSSVSSLAAPRAHLLRNESSARVHFAEPVALRRSDGASVEGVALNLSCGGIFVCSKSNFDLYQHVRVRFDLPGGGPIDAQASIVRCGIEPNEPRGVALRFDDMSEDCGERLQHFVSARLEPAAGQQVRLELTDIGSVVAAKAHSSWDNMLSVDAELPFLRLGSEVQVQTPQGSRHWPGSVRWVAVHIDTHSGVPRLNIGIELGVRERAPDPSDERYDPVLTDDFARHVRAREQSR